MRKVGSYEAKTRLPELLKAVEKGETIVVTRHGRAVARIVPVAGHDHEDAAEVIVRMKQARARREKVGRAEILAARDEGRKG